MKTPKNAGFIVENETAGALSKEPPFGAVYFKNFSFRYRARSEKTLDSINLTIHKGEKILIAGRSGCGKTTLAHCINGLIPHAFAGKVDGEFKIMGREALNMGVFGASKFTGTVLQDSDGQFVGLTAAEDIAFALENDCVPAEEMFRRVKEAAERVQIDAFLNKSPQNLSGGQKQRVSMAGVLVNSPDILLFDEPLANLDPASGKNTIELIDRLHKETGKTIIIIEHRIEDVLHRDVDRIILLENGKIIADATPAKILELGVLALSGVREPLYVSAVRYAGIEFTASQHPENIDLFEFDVNKLNAWNDALGGVKPMRPAGSFLSVENIFFNYWNEETDAVCDVSFSAEEGEAIAIAGRNGAGKSTLASIIAGFYKPRSGNIFLNGKNLNSDSIKKRAEKIGYVLQNPNQMISFPKIFDEAALALRMRNVEEYEVKLRVEEALHVCGLHKFRNWPVSALSFGQKKRLTIASIITASPSVIILDEPTAGQDFMHYSEIMEFLRELNRRRGLTILMITHDMHLMLEYTDRVIVMSGARIIADDAPATVLSDDAVVEAAGLKRTSLYTLALKAGIKTPQNFIRHFIDFERNLRDKPYGGGKKTE
ncbi:MAG: ABC transporter ATP-binding protein [Spirochaetaceae bacterium]|nr:ABC transporter ATP-binding protein [Spirochaetaceae bacterium]